MYLFCFSVFVLPMRIFAAMSALFPASMKTRILLFVVCFEITAYGTITLFNNYIYKNALIEQKNAEITQTFAASVAKINKISQLMERNVTSLAIFGEHLYHQRTVDKLSMAAMAQGAEQILLSNFTDFDQAIGGGIWYEPFALDKDIRYFGPYAFRDEKGVQFSWDLNTPEYDYLNQDWYTIASVANIKTSNKQLQKRQRIIWTEPYFDQAATFTLMMTVDALMFDPFGNGIGMATVDWSLAELTTFLDSVKLSANAWPFFIYQGQGKFLSFVKDPSKVLQDATQFDWGQTILADSQHSRLVTLSNITIDDQPYNIYYFRTTNGFVFGSLMPLKDLHQSISTITTITLLAGCAIGVSFIALMVLWMRLLFSPFDKVLALIKGSITHQTNGKQGVVIAPIHYRGQNEFTPITEALDEVYQQVTDYLEQIKTSRQEIASLNAGLEAKVISRTRQLEGKTAEAVAALEQLQVTQLQLIENEKHAALGRLVAGVAHEINTPLGISVTAASYVDKAFTEVFEGMIKGQLKRSQLIEKYVEICEGCKILNGNLQRASELVTSFKLVAVDQSGEDCRQLKLYGYIDDVIRSLKPQVNKTTHKVQLRGDKGIELYTQPGALAHVLTSLIDNALIHGLSARENGVIDIMVQRVNQRIELKLTDNGKGMDNTIVEHIFDPFFTTNRDSGSCGLGMHVVYNLVTQTLHGAIVCQSVVGEGTTFIVILPEARGAEL